MTYTMDHDSRYLKQPIAIANWLFFVAFTVFIMVVIGGITRLTESGLSITEWKLITGALPPLNEAAWLAEFEKYKLIPEYIEINGPSGHGSGRFQVDLFLGMDSSILGASDWACFCSAFCLVRDKKGDTQRLWFSD